MDTIKRLRDVADVVMGQSPPGTTYNEEGEGLPFYQGVRDFGYRSPEPRVFCTRPSRIAQGGDVLLSVRAPIGRVNVAERQCAIGRGLCVIRPKSAEDARYLEFVLRYLEPTWHSIEGGGSVFGNATREDVESLTIPWPDSAAQRGAIAGILGALDDKIALNRRLSGTLEAMAQALFQSWFVDFDPVRAKAEGRAPEGLSPEVAALFPSAFQDSELGEIPEGWEVASLDQIATFTNGLALQRYPPEGDDWLPVIRIAQLHSGSTDDADRASAALDADYIVQDGDVLFSWSGSLDCVLWAGGPGALNQHLFRVTSEVYPKWFCYMWVLQHLDEFRAIASGKATTMGHIQRQHLSQARVIIPCVTVLSAADAVLGPVIEQSWRLRVQNRTLASLRDALLPPLVSGALRVFRVERPPVRHTRPEQSLVERPCGPAALGCHPYSSGVSGPFREEVG